MVVDLANKKHLIIILSLIIILFVTLFLFLIQKEKIDETYKEPAILLSESKIYVSAEEIVKDFDEQPLDFCDKISDGSKKGCYYLAYLLKALESENFNCPLGDLPEFLNEREDVQKTCKFVISREKDECLNIKKEPLKEFCLNLFNLNVKEDDLNLHNIKIILNAIDTQDESICDELIQSSQKTSLLIESYLIYCKEKA